MFPIINIGPLAIQAPGLILLLSLWFGTWMGARFAKNLATNGEVIETCILFGLISSLIGARIGFLLQNLEVLIKNPLSLVSLTPSMLNTSFGLLTGTIVAIIIAQKKQIPLLPTLDTITPIMVLFYTGHQLSNFASGDAYGLPTLLPWGIQLWNASRHPVQLYAVGLIILVFSWLTIKTQWFKKTGFLRSGILFTITAAGLAIINIFTRAFLAEKVHIFGVDALQLISLVILAGSLIIHYKINFQPRKHITVFISLGSNSEPEQNLAAAREKMTKTFTIRQVSKLYQSEDQTRKGNPPQFLNQVIEIDTSLPYPSLVKTLKSIEAELGRDPGNKIRVPIDLDILTYNGDVFSYQGTKIPAPDILTKPYLVIPLAELAPNFQHPASGISIHKIVDSLGDKPVIN